MAADAMLPSLKLEDWRDTRDALHEYSRVLGNLRRAMTPSSKHWWHITLHVSARGLTTTPIPVGPRALELVLNPVEQRVELDTSYGEHATIELAGLSQRALADRLAGEFQIVGIEAPSWESAQWEDTVRDYDDAAASRYWQALTRIDGLFREFKGSLREETGPVQVFPHHFDLSLNWFSGRLVPGVDPADEESADEQMNFGFVPGDSGIDAAYFYATAYPVPAGLIESDLPDGAYWQTEGFTGAVLPYDTLADRDDARSRLLEFLQAAHGAGASLMR